MATNEERVELQRDGIWKWRWLGWRDSTSAFKASMAILGIAAIALAVFAMR